MLRKIQLFDRDIRIEHYATIGRRFLGATHIPTGVTVAAVDFDHEPTRAEVVALLQERVDAAEKT